MNRILFCVAYFLISGFCLAQVKDEVGLPSTVEVSRDENGHFLGGHKINHSEEEVEQLLPPTFSQPPGWYTNHLDVLIQTEEEHALILYTLDGSEPNIHNLDGSGEEYLVNYFFHNEWSDSKNLARRNSTYIYEGALRVGEKTGNENDLSNIITTYDTSFGIYWKKPENNIMKGQVIRAKVFKDGGESPTVTASYFIHPEGSSRYSLPTLSVVSDSENIFGYEKGIYVQGKTYFDAGGTASNYVDFANFAKRGIEWERPVHTEFFGLEGKLEYSQQLGMRIHGGGSRSRPMKGFRLYARNDYDASNTMSYPFFPASKDVFGAPMDEYKHLLVRMGGDRMDVFTDAATHRIMEPAKVDVQRSTPVIHFINGEYWGIANLRDRLGDHFISGKYQIDTDNLIILDAPWGTGSAADVEAGDPEDIHYYRNLFNYVVDNDMSLPEHYRYFKERVDVLSYIDYNVLFIYLSNADWYGEKHFRYWRAKNTSPLPYQDGKWRFMIWDFDIAPQSGPDFDMLINFIHPQGGGNDFASGDPQKTALLRNLLENEEFRHLFLNRFSDHINTLFEPERMEKILVETYDRLRPELEEHAERWHYQWATEAKLNNYIHFAKTRATYQYEQLCRHLGIEGTLSVTLDIERENSGSVQINTIDISPQTAGVYSDSYPWQGTYFKNVPIELEAKAKPGFELDYWLVNEQRHEGEKISVVPTEDISVKAYFREAAFREHQLVHYWFFDNSIPNDSPLTTIDPHFNLYITSKGELEFQPAISPYPPESGTMGIMDRVNDPTIMNYQEKGNKGIPFSETEMRGIRVRNPLQVFDNGELREGALILKIPTEYHEHIKLSLAVSRTNNGPSTLMVEYATQEDGPWLSEGLEENTVELYENFQLVTFDFGAIDEANDNPDFKVRFKFGGDNIMEESGNARFNNIGVEGIQMREEIITSLPTLVTEEKSALVDKIFPNPASGYLNLEFKTNSWSYIRSVEIINSQGVSMKSYKVPSEPLLSIPVDDLPAGTYTIIIATHNQLEIMRFIKL